MPKYDIFSLMLCDVKARKLNKQWMKQLEVFEIRGIERFFKLSGRMKNNPEVIDMMNKQ